MFIRVLPHPICMNRWLREKGLVAAAALGLSGCGGCTHYGDYIYNGPIDHAGKTYSVEYEYKLLPNDDILTVKGPNDKQILRCVDTDPGDKVAKFWRIRTDGDAGRVDLNLDARDPLLIQAHREANNACVEWTKRIARAKYDIVRSNLASSSSSSASSEGNQ